MTAIAKLFALTLLLFTTTLLHAASSMNLSKTASVSTVNVGTNFIYELSYNCVSDTSHCDNVVITDVLPSNIEYVSHTTSSHTASAAFDAPSNTLTYTMNTPLAAGSTGTMEITVRIKSGTTPNGTVIDNTATAIGDGINNSDTATVTATATDSSTLTKTRTSAGYLNENTTYRLRFCAGGQLSVSNAILVDTLPAKAQYISSTNGGVHSGDPLGGTISWNLGNLNAGQCVNSDVTVAYTEANGMSDGESVTNNAEATYTPLGMTQQSRTGSITHTVDAYVFVANPSLNVNKWASVDWIRDDELAAQGPITYYLELQNNGNVDLNDTVLSDAAIPFNEFDVTSFSTGTYSEAGTFEIFYRTNLNSTYTSAGTFNREGAAQVITVASLALAGGEYITGLEWRFGSTSAGFDTNTAVQIVGDFLSPKRDTSTYSYGDTFYNEASASANYNATPLSDSEGHTITIRDNYSVPFADKSLLNAKTYQVGDEVRFQIRVRNQNTGTGDIDGTIVVSDLLPEGLEYNATGGWSWTATSSTLPDPTFTQTADYNGTGRTLLKWEWSGANMPYNTYGDLRFNANTTLKAAPPSIVNSAYITVNGAANPFSCASGVADTNDLDGDSDTTDTLCRDNQTINIQPLNGLDSIKWVQGVLDANWSKYPDSGYTLPGGKADYNLTITNNGNVPADNIVIIDILPFVGDTGVNDLNDRLTVWRPNLAGAIVPPAGDAGTGMAIYYSTSGNPCRDDFTSVSECEDPEWSLTPPGDITQVYSVKIVFRPDFILQGGESAHMTWPMLAPIDAPTNGDIAWNSFAYKADKTTGGTFQPAEPNKVGIAMNPDNNATYGDTVWLDLDKDGLQDTNELGVNGVTVELYDNTDTLLASTITATDYFGNMGKYLFVNLPSGDYYAKFTLPVGYEATLQDQGADDALDSDVDPITLQTPLTHLDAGEHDRTWDLGIYSDTKACIGDHVFDDADVDGVQDMGENGVGGVRVKLYDSADNFIDVTATTIKGDYLFCGLDAGDYYLTFTPPPTFVVTQQDSGGDDALDSDVDADTNQTVPTALAAGENDMTWDMGVYQQAQIGNFVWFDADADGIQDVGEAGVADVNVTLFYSDGTYADSMLTDATGHYSFGPREPGSYYLEFNLSNLSGNYHVSPQDAGGDDALDSDVDPTTLRTVVTTLDEDEHDTTWDMGIYRPVALGDLVWLDYNGDGLQTAEAGVSGVHVKLYNGSGVQITQDAKGVTFGSGGTLTTDANGNYRFDELRPGSYYVVFENLPSGYVVTLKNVASDDTVDSDAERSAPYRSATATLASGDENLTLDMGIFIPASLGDLVWLDVNGNGIQDAGEPGVSGATVALSQGGSSVTDVYGSTLSTVATDASGNYLFENLFPGSYDLTFTTPSGYMLTLLNVGTYNSDSDASPSGGTVGTTSHTLYHDEHNRSLDAGIYALASLGDQVWYDNNRNGLQDEAEGSVADVEVYLLDKDGLLIDTNTTDAQGLYRFFNLHPGNYYVEFNLSTLPASYYQVTTKNSGSDDTTDSDANGGTGRSDLITIQSGDDNRSIDMGVYIPEAGLGNLVWHDRNANGIQESGEEGIEGVNVCLRDENGSSVSDANGTLISCVSTATGGVYSFENLDSGCYRVHFTLPQGYALSPKGVGGEALDSDVNASDMRTDSVCIDASTQEYNPDQDMGLYRLGALGDTVWFDADADQNLDSNESGLGGVTVRLLDNNHNELSTTVTDGNGNYRFENLLPGSYCVAVDETTLPSDQNWTITTHNNPECYTLGVEEEYLDLDFGYDHDCDGDGIPNGIEGTTDTDGDGTPDNCSNDSDGDGTPDDEEGLEDTDEDGIPDYIDYDPSGYFYESDTGVVVPGGSVSVTCNPAQTIDMIKDGSDGMFQWHVLSLSSDTLCTMTVNVPDGYRLDESCPVQSSPLDPTGQSNPYYVGSSVHNGSGTLIDANCSVNPWYVTFDLSSGDPEIRTNNIPLVRIPVTVPTLSEWGRIFSVFGLLMLALYAMRRRAAF